MYDDVSEAAAKEGGGATPPAAVAARDAAMSAAAKGDDDDNDDCDGAEGEVIKGVGMVLVFFVLFFISGGEGSNFRRVPSTSAKSASQDTRAAAHVGLLFGGGVVNELMRPRWSPRLQLVEIT